MPENRSNLDVLDPVANLITLTCGDKVRIKALKFRQFMKLLKIITHGGAGALANGFDLGLSGQDTEAFITNLTALIIIAIPETEDEILAFLLSMIEVEEDTPEAAAKVSVYLEDPEIEDVISILEVIVKTEGADLQALGKRLTGMLNLAQKTGQLPENLNQKTSTSSEDSLSPSTLSLKVTDGPMKQSSTLL